MKKRIISIVLGVCMLSGILAGCSSGSSAGGGTISNEYVEVKGYKGVEIAKVEAPAEITDEEVEGYILSIQEQNAETKEVTDRAAQLGDVATIDFVGKMDGEAFEGGSGEDYPLELGSGTFIEGFEDSVVGHKIGETFDWEGAFPEDYQSTDLAGKDVVFTITLNALSEKSVPELTDEFVKTVSPTATTVEEYKEEVKKELQDTAEEEYAATVNVAAYDEVMKNVTVKKYPEGEVEKMKQSFLDQYVSMAEMYGMEYDQFVEEYMQTTVEEFEAQAEEAAKERVKQNLAIELIAEKEKLTPTEEQYEEEYEKLAATYGYGSVEEMKEIADEETLKMLVLQPLIEKWLGDNCKQVENKTDAE